MNEESAIFTSMNMSKVSDDKSLDLGYIAERNEEFNEIQSFYKKHIKGLVNNDITIAPLIGVKMEQANNKETIPPIKSDEYWVKTIHEHIHKNYGTFKFKYSKNELLEYLNFIKTGYKIQFLPYTQAIRVHICLPNSITEWDIEKKIRSSSEIKKLHKKDELEFGYDSNQKFLKYYFADYNVKLSSRGMELVNKFLLNLDIILKSIYN